MYKIAICDDDCKFADNLKKITADIMRELNITYDITVYTKAQELMLALDEKPDRFHLLMLDILLGKMNGVALAAEIRKKGNMVSVLFITEHKEFSLEGYSVHPLDYLLKPVQKHILCKIIEEEYYDKFIPRHILISINHIKYAVDINSIRYVEMLNRRIIIHTETKILEQCSNLKEFMKNINSKLFIRCHKSFLVNMSKMVSVSKKRIVLSGNISIPVGRAYYDHVIHSFTAFLQTDFNNLL